MPQDAASTITRLAKRYGLDPRALIAVARGEGGLVNRAGDIGDKAGGGSYGPFQLYAQGALPSQYRGQPQQADTWAWSPQGIDYALRKMREAGAGGLTGEAAINAIVRKFERPRDPDSSVANALARYGDQAPAATMTAGSPGPAAAAAAQAVSTPQTTPVDRRAEFARGLLEARRSREPGARRSLLMALATRPPEPPPPAPSAGAGPAATATSPAPAAAGAPSYAGSLAELFYDPEGAYDEGKMIPAIGGHRKHVHSAFDNPQAALAAIRLAQKMGLSVRENPYVDPVDPVHTEGSFHYQTFPGKYNGRTLGRGLDVSGDPDKMRAYYRAILRRYGR